MFNPFIPSQAENGMIFILNPFCIVPNEFYINLIIIISFKDCFVYNYIHDEITKYGFDSQ